MSTAPPVHADDEILTPTVQRFLRRSLFWISITMIIIVIAVIGLAFSNSVSGSTEPLGPANPAPEGTKALVQVLGQEGVDVSVTSSLAATEKSVDDAAGTTLVVYDPNAILTENQWDRVSGLAETIVLIEPGFLALTELAPEVYQSGAVDDEEIEAGCRIDSAEAAGSISGGGVGYRTDDSSHITCFDSGDDTYSLVQLQRDGATITVLGASDSLTNGRILEKGNAALALRLLGSQPYLTWYAPGLEDYGDAPATVADFSPAWVFPVGLTLLLLFIAIAVWRGRRFGPLIVENLPVTVRSSETMHGRARLYQHSSARLHAIDSLRIGTIDRLSSVVGLPRLATVDEVVRSVASISGRNDSDVRSLLVDAVPQNDRELLELSDQLLLLEGLVTSKLRSR